MNPSRCSCTSPHTTLKVQLCKLYEWHFSSNAHTLGKLIWLSTCTQLSNRKQTTSVSVFIAVTHYLLAHESQPQTMHLVLQYLWLFLCCFYHYCGPWYLPDYNQIWCPAFCTLLVAEGNTQSGQMLPHTKITASLQINTPQPTYSRKQRWLRGISFVQLFTSLFSFAGKTLHNIPLRYN